VDKKLFLAVGLGFLLNFCSSVRAWPLHIVWGSKTWEMQVEGIDTHLSFGEKNRILYGKVIYSESDFYQKLTKLDQKCRKLYCEASCLSEELFESAATKDKEDKWRYRDCVNFDFDAYIHNEERAPELKNLWEMFLQTKTEMQTLVLEHFELN
jgi:hypothetical protein